MKAQSKVDPLREFNWTVQWHKSERSLMKLDGPKKKVFRHEIEWSKNGSHQSGRSEGMKMDGPGIKKGSVIIIIFTH